MSFLVFVDCFCDKWFVVCRFRLNGFKSLQVCFKRPLLLEKRPASMTTCISCISMWSRLWFPSEFMHANCAKQVKDRSWCSTFCFQESIPRSKYHGITSLRTTKLQSNYLAVKHAGRWTHVFYASRGGRVVLREHALPYSMCLEPQMLNSAVPRVTLTLWLAGFACDVAIASRGIGHWSRMDLNAKFVIQIFGRPWSWVISVFCNRSYLITFCGTLLWPGFSWSPWPMLIDLSDQLSAELEASLVFCFFVIWHVLQLNASTPFAMDDRRRHQNRIPTGCTPDFRYVGVPRVPWIPGYGKWNPEELCHLASAETCGPCLMFELQTKLVTGKI